MPRLARSGYVPDTFPLFGNMRNWRITAGQASSGTRARQLELFGDAQVDSLDPEVAVAEGDEGVGDAGGAGADAGVDIVGRREDVVEVHEGVADVERRAGGEAVAEVQADFGDGGEFVAGMAADVAAAGENAADGVRRNGAVHGRLAIDLNHFVHVADRHAAERLPGPVAAVALPLQT